MDEFETKLVWSINFLREKDEFSIIPFTESVYEIDTILTKKDINEDACQSMVKLGNLLVRFRENHVAFFFYHTAWEHYKVVYDFSIYHDAMLQMGKIIWTDSTLMDKKLAFEMFTELAVNYNSAEAKSYLDDMIEDGY